MNEQPRKVITLTYRLTHYPNHPFPFQLVWNTDRPFVRIAAFRFTADAADAVVRLNATGSF